MSLHSVRAHLSPLSHRLVAPLIVPFVRWQSNAGKGGGGQKGGVGSKAPPPKGSPTPATLPPGAPKGAAAAAAGKSGAGGDAPKKVTTLMAPPPLEPFSPNYGAPTTPETLSIQLRLKAYHKFYLNRYVFLLARRFKELGLPRPSQAFLPKKRERFTVLRSPHVDKRARDQFERVTHKRLITFTIPQDAKSVELSYRLMASTASLSPGVQVRAKYHSQGLENVGVVRANSVLQ